MAKDPAFLFYHEDFFAGVSDMSNDEVGAYVRCMCVQASKGGISEKHMKKICETREVYMSVISKFFFNETIELYQNARLALEVDKRRNFVDSRSRNRAGKTKQPESHETSYETSYVNHMENEIVNEKENEDLGKGGKGEKPFKQFAHLSISEDEHNKLLDEYLEQDVLDIYESIENYKKNTQYKSLYLTAKKWLAKEKTSAKKESNEPKVGRMTLSDAQKSIMNAASARIPGT